MGEIGASSQACRSCGELKPLAEFDRRADTGGYHTLCKDCRRIYQRERWRRAHPPKTIVPRLVGSAQEFVCTRCGAIKPAAGFPLRRRGHPELHWWCRDCFAEIHAKQYVEHHEREVGRGVRNKTLNRLDRQSRTLEYLETHRCVDCGERDPVVLEFDHRADKRFDVAIMVNRGMPWSDIAVEIAKCDIRCANCHRLQTLRQRGLGREGWLQLELISEEPSPMSVPGPLIHPDELRTCRRCGALKGIEEFNFRSRARGQRSHVCRDCQSAYHREWYKREHRQQIRRLRRNRRRGRKRSAGRVLRYLATHPCVDCGESDVRLLDFDHLREKRAEVGWLARRGYSWSVIAAEIAKCQIRCANCHRRRTTLEARGYRVRAKRKAESEET